MTHIDPHLLQKTLTLLQAEIKRLQNARTLFYDTQYAAINIPFDTQLLHQITTTVAEKKALKPTMLIVIGIGGSNLGTIALVHATYGAFYNDRCVPHIYFVDTVDADYTISILKRAEKELQLGNTILINLISKSGTTSETMINYELFVTLLKKYHPHDYHNFIVATTDENSELWNRAQQEHITTLAIPRAVGGRFSVFSAVGLFPLAFVGIDCAQLQEGAQNAINACLSKDAHNNPAALNAAYMYLWYQQGYTIHNLFLFSVALENLGKWYRQLLAESIGKLHDKQGEVVHVGITPIVSIGTTDLHSMAQLYLSGPPNTATTFVSAPSHTQLYSDNKSLSDIMNVTLHGTMKAYQKRGLPFAHYSLKEKTPYYIAEFMQIKMCEIIYLGFLLNINPFDQPEVELYKKETQKIG